MIRGLTNKEIVHQYIDDVLSGRIVAGKLVKAACQRHLDDLKNAKKKGIYFDEKIANEMVDFFPLLKHTTGEYDGHPFHLYPFQMFIVWCVTGWRKCSNKMRRFKTAFISLARGNGKSPFAAALLLLLFAFDNPIEARAECYTVATKKDQARIVFNETKRFVSRNPDLRKYINVLRSSLDIPANDSTLVPLGSDSENTDGLIPHVVSADELHAWREQHRGLWDKIITALGKRQQPLLLIITTAGDERSELWLDVYEMAVAIVDRDSPIEAEDEFVFIAEIDDEDDPLDPDVWAKANPMLEFGVVKVDHLRAEAAKAKRSPAALTRFKRYHGNKVVTSVDKLIDAKLWARGNEPLPELKDLTAHSGFDWGWRNDLTGLVHVFAYDKIEVVSEIEEDGETQEITETKSRYAVLARAWIPEGCERNLTSEPWASWIRDGWLQVTQGDTTDTSAIYAQLARDAEEFAIGTIAMDPNNCREFGSTVETRFGIEPFWFGQTTGKYNEPLRELLAALHEGRIVHARNPLLAWNIKNLVVKTDARDYMMPAKKKAREKIDLACALIMGLSECLFAEREETSVYEEAGQLYL